MRKERFISYYKLQTMVCVWGGGTGELGQELLVGTQAETMKKYFLLACSV